MAGGKPGQDHTRQHSGNGEAGDDAPDRQPLKGLLADGPGEDLRLKTGDIKHHDSRDQPLDNRDGQVDRQHQGHEGAEGQIRDSGEGRLQDNRHGAEAEAHDRAGDRADDDAGGTQLVAHNRSVDEWVGDEGREDPKVEDVRTKGQQAPIGKEQGLDGQHRSDHQEGRLRSEQDREQQTATDVAAGAGGRDGEIHHLGREHEGTQYPHQRHLGRVGVAAQRAGTVSGGQGRGPPHRPSHRVGEEGVSHMHQRVLSGRKARNRCYGFPKRVTVHRRLCLRDEARQRAIPSAFVLRGPLQLSRTLSIPSPLAWHR